MRERIAQMLPDNRSRHIRMGTFHSVFSAHPARKRQTDRLPRVVHDLRLLGQPEPGQDRGPRAEPSGREVQAQRRGFAHILCQKLSGDPGAYLANSAYAAEDRQMQIPSSATSTTSTASAANTTGRWTSTTCCCKPTCCCATVRTCWRATRSSSNTFWWTSTRTPTMRSTSSSAVCRRPIRKSASWATTRSRSTRSAGPRSKTSSLSRRTTPRRRSSSSNRTTARRARSSMRPTR